MTDEERAAEQLMEAMERLLHAAHDKWEPNQADPTWDELAGAMTAVYQGWKFAAHTGVLPRGPERGPEEPC